MKTIHLLRHGEIDRGSPRRFIGQTNCPLTSKGIDQSNQLGKHLKNDSGVSAILFSPLLRCSQGAEILSCHLNSPMQLAPGFKEISLGKWEGLTVEQVKKTYPTEFEKRGADFENYRPDNGESFNDLRQRVWPAFIETVENVKGNLVIVSHAGVNRIILSSILGIPLDKLFLLEQHYCCLNTIHFFNKSFSVECINSTIHLP